MYREFKKRQNQVRKKFNVNWTNEGNLLLSRHESHHIDLELNIQDEDGKVIGLLKIREKSGDFEHNNLSVNGKTCFRAAKLILSDIQRKHLVTLQ